MLFSRQSRKTLSNHQRTHNETISVTKGHTQPICVRLAKAGDKWLIPEGFSRLLSLLLDLQ
jgi:hypothetical protein